MSGNLEQQRIADLFNEAIGRIKDANMSPDGKTEHNADSRRAAIYALQRFEAAPWYPQVLDEAVHETHAATFDFACEHIDAAIDNIREVLERYIEIVEERTGAPAIQNEMFTARHASWYIARQLTRRGIPMSFAGIDKHIRVTKTLRGQKAGNVMLFSRQHLDEFVANFDKLPKRGRPRQDPVTG